MNNTPKISIIIPCYNVEQYVHKCIESVINQTYSNLELILINDGSTDNTNEVILKEVEKYDNIIYIRNKNSGVSNARNTGISKATGDYIMFVDSDDYISKNMVKNMYNLMIKYKTDLAKCNIKLEYVAENIIKKQKPIYSKIKYVASENFPKTIYKKILSTETMNSSCCSLFKTSIIKVNNLSFKEDIDNGEDAIFFMNYIDKCESMVYTPTAYYNYLIRNTGLTGCGLSMDKLWNSKLKFINELKKKELEWNLENKHYVNSKIIYIVMSCIYRLYKKDKNESDEFKTNFLNKMLKDTNLIVLLSKVKYKKMNFTQDRISVLDNIKENNMNETIKLIKQFKSE